MGDSSHRFKTAEEAAKGGKFTLGEAFSCAFHGMGNAATTGRNFRLMLGCGVIAIVMGIVFNIDAVSWAAIAICIALVLGGECMNSALEDVVDIAAPSYQELAKHAKDCASGAVLIFSMGALAVGIVIFLPRILAMLG